MGRLVRVPREISNVDRSAFGSDDKDAASDGQLGSYVADGYLERIAKYVPAEMLAFSIFINAILDQTVKSGGKLTAMAGVPVVTVAMIAFTACWIFSPLFVWYVRQKGEAWVINAFVSFLAFPVWSYAIGNVAFQDYRDGNLAAILLVSFSLLSGLVAPRAPSPNRQEKQAVVPARGAGPQLVEIEQPPGTGWNRG
jgi:hypothetical protein